MPKNRNKPDPSRMWSLPGFCFGDYGITIVLHHPMTHAELTKRMRRLAHEVDKIERAATPGPQYVVIGEDDQQ